MDINRCKMVIVYLYMVTICFWLIPQSIQASDNDISAISDLSHKSEKLGAYRALIIGIDDYKDPEIPDLETAVNDAQAMANLLRELYGFQVELLLDRKATKKEIYQALRNLTSSAKPDDSVLIYYAGHGDLDRLTDDGWWIPADARGGDPVTYLDNIQVQKFMRSMKARHVLLISDSCYSGTLFGQVREMPSIIGDKYYLNLYNEKSRWGITSGNKTPVSDRGSGGHSVFAYQLLKELKINKKPYISTQELYTRIAPIISNNSEQTPLCRPIRNTGDQGGEFIFVVSSDSVFEKPVLVNPESIVMPDQTETALDDILKASEKKRKAAESWNQWQQARNHEYHQVKKIDKDAYLSSKQKSAVWQRFFVAVSQDNPFSREDDEMRTYSRSRLKYWQSVKPAETKPDLPVGFGGSEEQVTGKEGLFIAYSNGVVYDKNSGLEWFAGPDKSTDWDEAKLWAEGLNVAGGGWRMPTRNELKVLYQKGVGTRNMTPLLKTTGWWVWSSETKYSWVVYYFDFRHGRAEDFSPRRYPSYFDARGFAVRSQRQ